jgi:glycerol-3-phosphate cytidylyltransferase
MPEATAGYLFGIFDLFHIAHLDAIRMAEATSDHLIVGVASDELVEQVCGVRPFVPAIERIEIVTAVKAIAQVHVLESLDVQAEAARVGAPVVFVPGEELDAVQRAALNAWSSTPSAWSGVSLTHLAVGRRTASSQVRDALAGTTTRSSVA